MTNICKHCNQPYFDWIEFQFQNPTESTYELASLVQNAIYKNCCSDCAKAKLQTRELEEKIRENSYRINSIKIEAKFFKEIKKELEEKMLAIEYKLYDKKHSVMNDPAVEGN